MKKIFYITCISLIVMILGGCTDRNNHEIQEELEVYFDAFVSEAELYGHSVTLSKLDVSGYVENIVQRGVLGQCKTYSNGSKEVVIDQDFWNRSTDIQKEYIVFHELGHCILNREHLNAKDDDGNCLSIMQSGDGDCKGNYSDENRDRLLEELFSN